MNGNSVHAVNLIDIRLEERWHYIACLAFFFLSIAYLQQQQTATRSNILASVLHNISSNKLTVT